VRALGVKNLDLGLGCGVGIGYGFGAGLMLRPSAWDALCMRAADAAGSLSAALQSRLQQAGITPPPQLLGAPAAALWGRQAQPPAPQLGGGGASDAGSSSPQQEQQQQAGTQDRQQHYTRQQRPPLDQQTSSSLMTDTEVARALLRQQRQLDRLRRRNRQLRAAVCRLDPGARVCQRRDGSGSSSSEGW
jgi:hypothetical protein